MPLRNRRHLLLLSCSQRKRSDPEPLPALERYDGGAYRVIRKLQREGRWPFLVDVLILSAEYGLIDSDRPILNYEKRLDRDRAAELRPAVLAALQRHLGTPSRQYASVYVDLGSDYLPLVMGIEELCGGAEIVWARGRIGERLANLRRWLLDRWIEEPIVPFFVADRPRSLKLLKGLPLQSYPSLRIGIMAHANTSLEFQRKLRDYPCEDRESCDAIGGKPCPFSDDVEACPDRSYIVQHTIKMCDSGIFTREGATLSYSQLFDAYERMGVEYGVMIDVFRDSRATLESARKGLQVYRRGKRSFRLVGVAHGRTVEEYLECYRQLREMGFNHVAVGGLLRRVGRSVRYTQVRSESFMYEVLDALRERYPDDWLFALGCFHPSRLAEFEKRHVWGDYKGWIFQYERVDDTLTRLLEDLRGNDLQHLNASVHQELTCLSDLESVIGLRAKLVARRKEVHGRLLEGRRRVREGLHWLWQMMGHHPEVANSLQPVVTHALLDEGEIRRVRSAMMLLPAGKDRERGRELLSQVHANRALKARVDALDKEISSVNRQIAAIADEVARTTETVFPVLVTKCKQVSRLARMPESDYRAMQTRENIASRILDLLA